MSTEHLNFRELLDFGIGSPSPPSRSSLPFLLRFSQVHCSCSYITRREGDGRGRGPPEHICIFGKVAIRRGKRKSASLAPLARSPFESSSVTDLEPITPARTPRCRAVFRFGHFLSQQTLSSLNALKYSMHPYSSLEGFVISYPSEFFACTSNFLFDW